MIILLISLIIILFVTIIIDVILYDYDVSYRTHRVLAYIVYFTLFALLIVAIIACISTSNSSSTVVTSGSGLSGTWRAMGYGYYTTNNESPAYYGATLWLRIA